MMGLSSRKAIQLLSESSDNYIHHYMGDSTIHNLEGDDIGTISWRVFNNLLNKEKIHKVANSDSFWSQGYYRLK